MAVWQYDLFLVGRGDALPLLTDDGWDLPQLSAASTLSAQRSLVGSMGYPWLMMDDWVVFGSENGTRIDFIFSEADEVEIRVRLNASATETELDAVCTFAGELGSRLFDPATRALLQPDRSSVASALGVSHAATFSSSPELFLSWEPSNSPAHAEVCFGSKADLRRLSLSAERRTDFHQAFFSLSCLLIYWRHAE